MKEGRLHFVPFAMRILQFVPRTAIAMSGRKQPS